APEENARPAPVSSTARTALSAARASTASRRSRPSCRFQALSLSGRFRVIVAAPSATATSIVSKSLSMAGSLRVATTSRFFADPAKSRARGVGPPPLLAAPADQARHRVRAAGARAALRPPHRELDEGG